MAFTPGRPSQQIFGGLGGSKAPVNQSLSAGTAVPIVHVDGNIVSDKSLLAKTLLNLSFIVRQIASSAFANPFASSVLIRDVPVTSGTPIVVNHLLGRPLTTWQVLRPRGASWAGVEVTPQPSYIDATRQVIILPSSTGTYDFLFC